MPTQPIIVVLFDTVIGMLRTYLFCHITSRVDVELGAWFCDHISDLPLTYFEARPMSQTVARARVLDTLRGGAGFLDG